MNGSVWKWFACSLAGLVFGFSVAGFTMGFHTVPVLQKTVDTHIEDAKIHTDNGATLAVIRQELATINKNLDRIVDKLDKQGESP